MITDVLESLKRNAARKSNLDADKELMERAAAEIIRLRKLLIRAHQYLPHGSPIRSDVDDVRPWAETL